MNSSSFKQRIQYGNQASAYWVYVNLSEYDIVTSGQISRSLKESFVDFEALTILLAKRIRIVNGTSGTNTSYRW